MIPTNGLEIVMDQDALQKLLDEARDAGQEVLLNLDRTWTHQGRVLDFDPDFIVLEQESGRIVVSTMRVATAKILPAPPEVDEAGNVILDLT